MAANASHVDLEALQHFAEGLAKKAGAMMLEAVEKRWKIGSSSKDGSAVDFKKNSVDLVTETDQAVEAMILSEIKSRYPDHHLCGEESFAASGKSVVEMQDAPTWIVDPIDGTTSFVHGYPMFCCSIGFAIDRIPVVGVVYNPTLDQLYTARSGGGAFCNGRQLPFSHPNPLPLDDLGSALILIEGGSLRGQEIMHKRVDTFKRILADGRELEGGLMAHGVRSQGSAALNYCAVAAGIADIYYETGCYSWDVAAGVIIAREAGGRCYGRNGKPFDEAALVGRHFSVIRAIGNPDEANEDAQDRLIRHLFDTAVADFDV